MEEERNAKEEEGIVAKKDTQIVAEEKLEEVDLGSDPLKSRPISISSKLSGEENSELILLLKEFRDVFAWDYNKMPGLDLGLVVHTLNVDPEAKPVAQPTRVFHTKIEEQIVKEMQKLLFNIELMKKKNGQIRCCVDFRNLH